MLDIKKYVPVKYTMKHENQVNSLCVIREF